MKQLTPDEFSILQALKDGAIPFIKMINMGLPVKVLPALEKRGMVKEFDDQELDFGASTICWRLTAKGEQAL